MRDQMVKHFNELLSDEGDLGNLLFGDFGKWSARMGLLDTNLKQEYLQALNDEGIFEIDEDE